MEVTSVIVIISATACAAALIWSYRGLNGPFFLYLSAAGVVLSCGAVASCFTEWPPAGALADLGLAASGILLAAAARQLLEAFRLAGGDHD